MNPIKRHKVRFLNRYKALDEKYGANGELMKLINYFFKRNWIYNACPMPIKDVINIYLTASKFHIEVCFDGGYSECEGYIKVYADLRNQFNKTKYCAIQFEIYKDNVDTFIKMLERIENDRDYHRLVNDREYLFKDGWIREPDPKFKHPKGLY